MPGGTEGDHATGSSAALQQKGNLFAPHRRSSRTYSK
jgi:hypothetical protein